MSGGPALNATTPVDALLFARVQQFLAHEIWLLDERQFESWLGLFTDDLRYWMPVLVTTDDFHDALVGEDGLAWFDENYESLAMRVRRLQSSQAHAEHPASRTRRFTTLTKVDRIDDAELCVTANFAIYRSRRERDIDVFVGSRTDILRATDDGGFRIARRTLQLDQDIVGNRDMSVFF
jgi:3-phenylpropionate/cinnamic acid dioxygenase small subunit